MAIYIIVSAIRRLFQLNFLANFSQFAVQLLNFAVLLSYPINFFIYCRMSRAFRDAFTKLLCASLINTREKRLQSIGTPLLAKHCGAITNNIELETVRIEIMPASSVILNSTTNEKPIISLTPRNSNDIKKNSIGSLDKPRVLFSDDVHQSTNMKLTDL
jgi:hypothetical protein